MTGCRRRPSGSMPAGLGGRNRTGHPIWTQWRGGWRTQDSGHIRWPGRSPMPGGCLTCGGTYGSGCRTGTGLTRRVRRLILRGRFQGSSGLCGAARGSTGIRAPSGAPIATTTSGRTPGTTTTASGAPGRTNYALLSCPLTLCRFRRPFLGTRIRSPEPAEKGPRGPLPGACGLAEPRPTGAGLSPGCYGGGSPWRKRHSRIHALPSKQLPTDG